CRCSPLVKDGYPYIEWIGYYFGDCVYTPKEQLSFVVGYVALACYIVAQLPQIYKNYQRQSTDGLSIGSIFMWTAGDLTDLAGVVLTNQLVTQKWTGVYFLVLDFIMIGQWLHYRAPSRGLEDAADAGGSGGGAGGDDDGLHAPSERDPLLADTYAHSVVTSTFLVALAVRAAAAFPSASTAAAAAALTAAADAVGLCAAPPMMSLSARVVGSVLSWICGVFYFSARIPQIVENHQKRSVAGLSIMLFVLTIAGNAAYGIAILLRLPALDAHFYESVLPYLIGSLGTFVFDVCIITQSILY
ncbi:hypothetical protein CXG81DRAFT_3377, partial [Caulochytrium protostelioides]